MKANELMQYDWVCLEDDNTPRQVDWIRSGEVGLFWNQTVTPPYLEPVSLTQEILEKNGWEECNASIEDNDKQYGVTYGDFSFTWWRDARLLGCYRDSPTKGLYYEMITELPIEYVHELQHALKLCGIEKEIVV